MVEVTVSTVGIAESKKEYLDFKIYPNPATDYIFADIDHLTKNNLEVKGMDMNGRLVFHQKLNSFNSRINVGELPSGIYVFNFFSENELLGSKKVVIE